MESSLRYNRRRSGYEPSDTETEWHDSPANGHDHSRRQQMALLKMNARQIKSPYNNNTTSTNPDTLLTTSSALSRRNTTNNNNGACPFSQSERRTNYDHITESVSPFALSERRRHHSPYKHVADSNGSNHDMSWGRDRGGYGRRAASAPRSRMRHRGHQINYDQVSDIKDGPSVGEINEMVAKAKLSRMDQYNNTLDSIDDSISPGDVFFSRDYKAFQNADAGKSLPKPPGFMVEKKATINHSTSRYSKGGNGMSQTTSNSSSVVSRHSSVLSDTSGSTARFVASRRKSQSDTWFLCIKKGSSCNKSQTSPGKDRPFDEASFIGKAVVVESLRPLWADKHQPVSLVGFTCHKNEAESLRQLVCSEIFPHILLKGPPGTGKKALTMCLLREIYGDPVWNISHELRYFHILESKPMQVVVPVSSSPHHVELNVYLESKAAYALTALVKRISNEHAVAPEVSVAGAKANYKVIVLYDVDKAAENIQHLIKWIMDCYSDSCKLILCCEDDDDIIESVTSRCKVINVGTPSTHQIIEVLVQIAKKEGFELPTSFAAKITNKSKQNLRRAIMALEACKLHKYPFTEEQPIPIGWEEVVMELAADILTDPFPKRLSMVRGKIQMLLGEFVHPKLILLKLVGQFLRGVDGSLKREIYYWYAYYDKRLPYGTNALLKLEEFVAKFMSIHRKCSSNRQP